MKNFSISSSLVSATCSESSARYSSQRASASGVRAVELPSVSRAVRLSRSTRPTHLSPFIMGKISGTTVWPKVSRISSTTL